MSNGEREETVKGESGTWELTRAGWKSSLAAQEAMASEFVWVLITQREKERESVCVKTKEIIEDKIDG